MRTPVEIVLSAFLVEKVGIELLRPQLSQLSHVSLGTGQVVCVINVLDKKPLFCFLFAILNSDIRRACSRFSLHKS